MSLVSRITSLAEAIGAEFKSRSGENYSEVAHGFVNPNVVVLNDASGWRKANSANATDRVQLAGVVSRVYGVNDFQVVHRGLVNGFLGLTAGLTYYTSSTAGGVSSTWSNRRVGVAVSSTQIFVEMGVGNPIPDYSHSTKANDFSTASPTYVDITDLSVTIKPNFVNSKIEIIGSVHGGFSANNGAGLVQLYRDATAIAVNTSGSVPATMVYYLIASGASGNLLSHQPSVVFTDSPNTTSTVTYKFRAKTSGTGTFYVNRRGAANDYSAVSSITAREIFT